MERDNSIMTFKAWKNLIIKCLILSEAEEIPLNFYLTSQSRYIRNSSDMNELGEIIYKEMKR